MRFLGKVKVLHLKIGNELLKVEVGIENSNPNKNGSKDISEKENSKSINQAREKTDILTQKEVEFITQAEDNPTKFYLQGKRGLLKNDNN